MSTIPGVTLASILHGALFAEPALSALSEHDTRVIAQAKRYYLNAKLRGSLTAVFDAKSLAYRAYSGQDLNLALASIDEESADYVIATQEA